MFKLFTYRLANRVTMATLSPSQYESLRKYSSQQSILNTEEQMKGSLPLSPNKNAPLNEIKVFTADGKFVMVPLNNGINTPADSILEQALSFLNIDVELGRDVFALWTVSLSLELQLKPTHKPVRLLQQWLGHLNSYTDLTISESIMESPSLILKRSSYLQLKLERGVKNPVALYLLFCEAKNNFIKLRYTFSEMREILKLGAYLFLADEANQKSNLALDSLMFGGKINSYLPIKSQRSKSPLDVSTKSKKSSLSKQLFNAIQTQLAKGHNCANFRTLFLQACQNLAVYGAVFFEGVVDRPISLFSRLTLTKSDRQVYVALNATTLHILDSATSEVLFKLYYDHFSWLYQPPSVNGENQFCCLWIEFDSVMDHSLSVAKQLQIFSKQASLMDSLINHHVAQINNKAPQVEDSDRPQPISALVINQPIRTPHAGESNFSLHAFSLDGEEIPRSKFRRGMSTFKKSISSKEN